MLVYIVIGLVSIVATICVGLMLSKRFDIVLYAIISTFIVIVASGGWLYSQSIIGADNELLNGLVTDKFQVTRNCQTGWNSFEDPFCTEYETREVYDGQSCSGSGKDRVCTSKYHTEYRYLFAWERKWYVKSDSLNYTWSIRRVDRSGAATPPLWQATNIGDPASIYHEYQNWVKATSNSLFHNDAQYEEKYKAVIPPYPLRLINGWTAVRIVPIGVKIDNLTDWNTKLGKSLGILGPKKQMNAIVVIADSTKYPVELSYAVRRVWQGFKKNDAVIFIGIDQQNNVVWSNVMSWSKNSQFDVEMRNKILEQQTFNFDAMLTSLDQIGMQYYQRRSMKEFEYLKDDVPFDWFILGMTILGEILIISGYVYYNKTY